MGAEQNAFKHAKQVCKIEGVVVLLPAERAVHALAGMPADPHSVL
jgi:hypothetical protein